MVTQEHLGLVSLVLGDFDTAVKHFKTAIKAQPKPKQSASAPSSAPASSAASSGGALTSPLVARLEWRLAAVLLVMGREAEAFYYFNKVVDEIQVTIMTRVCFQFESSHSHSPLG